MGRWVKRLLILALVGAAVYLAVTRWLKPEPIAVRGVAVARGRVERTVTNSRAGTVKARRRARLAPQVGGAVLELPVREGERVKKGALLLRLDDRLEQAQLALQRSAAEAAAAAAEQARVQAAWAARELERHRRLVAQGLETADRLDRFQKEADVARAAARAAQAEVERARAAVRVAEAQLAKMRLYAPFAGIVAEIRAEVGEWITPAPPLIPVEPVIDLIDPEDLYVEAPIDEVDSALLRPGLPVRLRLDPFPGYVFPGTVQRVAPYVSEVEAQNRTVTIEVALGRELQGRRLLPGTSADVEVILEAKEGVLRIPAEALLEGGRVLVLEEGRLVERRVQVGLKNWAFAEVRGGLREGEIVITSLDRPDVRAGVPARLESDASP